MKTLGALVLFVVLAQQTNALGSPPTPSAAEIRAAIERDLVYHAPQYVVLLDEATPDRSIDDLVRAGIVERLGTIESCGPKSALALTEKGQTIAARRGWAMHRNMLAIPVGTLEYVENSARVLTNASGPNALRFTYRYTTLPNARVLLKAGPASDWETGDGHTLASAGRFYSRVVPLYYNAQRGWFLSTEWSRSTTHSC